MAFQFVAIGLLGEIQIRTYFENQNKEVYDIKKTLGDERTIYAANNLKNK